MTARPMPAHDRELEKIEEMGIEAAIDKLWRHDAALKWARSEHKDTSWPRHFITITVMGLGALGVTVVRDVVFGDVLDVKLPVSGYFKDALKEREAVSVPGLPEDIGRHGYYDPCEEALIRSGGLTDLGTFSFEEWVKNE